MELTATIVERGSIQITFPEDFDVEENLTLGQKKFVTVYVEMTKKEDGTKQLTISF